MRRTDAAAWVISVCAVSLRMSQAKSLGALVAAALSVERVSLANIGRAMLGGAATHQIKRCWRFCANDRVETAAAMRGVVKKVLRKRRKQPLLVSFDWTDIRQFQTLMASVVFKGRSVPVCWASCVKHVYDGHRSRNAFEESLLLVLRDMIPKEIETVIPASASRRIRSGVAFSAATVRSSGRTVVATNRSTSASSVLRQYCQKS